MNRTSPSLSGRWQWSSCRLVLGSGGAPVEVIKAILGPADVWLTLNLYRHVQPEEFERATAAMERRLAKI